MLLGKEISACLSFMAFEDFFIKKNRFESLAPWNRRLASFYLYSRQGLWNPSPLFILRFSLVWSVRASIRRSQRSRLRAKSLRLQRSHGRPPTQHNGEVLHSQLPQRLALQSEPHSVVPPFPHGCQPEESLDRQNRWDVRPRSSGMENLKDSWPGFERLVACRVIMYM